MIKLDDYVTTARSTAMYPESARFFYPVLGLAGEFGEMMDEMFPEHGIKIKIPQHRLISELGDVLWYVVNAALDVGFNIHALTDIVTGGLRCETFEDLCFQRLRPRDQRTPYLKATVAIGQLAEVAKKGLRDGYGTEMSVAKRAVVVTSLATMLGCLCEIAEKQQICLGQAAAENNAKLTSRKERGKIQGDGNER